MSTSARHAPKPSPKSSDSAPSIQAHQSDSSHQSDESDESDEARQIFEARQVAIKKVAARARGICENTLIDSGPVPSPCVSLCRVDSHTRWCDGCFRTVAEISKWSRLDEAGKRRVWQAIGDRAERVAAASAAKPL